MKLQVTFKTPNAIDFYLDEVDPEFSNQDDFVDGKKEFKEFAKKWVRYGELITVEFDSEAGTAIVIPTQRQ